MISILIFFHFRRIHYIHSSITSINLSPFALFESITSFHHGTLWTWRHLGRRISGLRFDVNCTIRLASSRILLRLKQGSFALQACPRISCYWSIGAVAAWWSWTGQRQLGCLTSQLYERRCKIAVVLGMRSQVKHLVGSSDRDFITAGHHLPSHQRHFRCGRDLRSSEALKKPL